MKNLKSIALALVVVLSTVSLTAQTKKVDASKSTINWVGKKVTGQHVGTIGLKDGALVFKGKKLVGGTFTVDMTSLLVTDLKAGDGKEDLEGHLKSEDFFGTDKFQTATLVFKTIGEKSKNIYTVTSDLTIKGKTNPITFDITVKGNLASTKLIVDRTKYDIKYKSKNFFENLGNKVIDDEFELAVALKI
jgi:polyisoprenoid-binding protein YceI